MFKYDYSAPHALLAIGKVDPMHPDLAVDPLGILRPATKLTHTLPLVTHLYIFCYFLVFLYIPDSSIVEFESDDHGSVLQVSAYSSFARIGANLGYEQQKRRVDPATNEPLFTNCTRDFIGTLDYIFYSGMSPNLNY